MMFTKAQSAILEEVGNTGKIANYAQRMKAIQPLMDANIISRSVIVDPKDGLEIGYKWELNLI